MVNILVCSCAKLVEKYPKTCWNWRSFCQVLTQGSADTLKQHSFLFVKTFSYLVISYFTCLYSFLLVDNKISMENLTKWRENQLVLISFDIQRENKNILLFCSSKHYKEWSGRSVTAVTTACVRWPGVLRRHCSPGQASVHQGIVKMSSELQHTSGQFLMFVFVVVGNVHSRRAKWRIYLEAQSRMEIPLLRP